MEPEVLFYALLPPIILEAGFSMKKRVRRRCFIAFCRAPV
jgi:hypothetical protein